MLERASSVPRSAERLVERRRSRRRFGRIAFFILLLLLLGAMLYGLRQPSVRISHIQISGTDVNLAHYATEAMEGMYLGLVPRNSFFFVPERRIRSAILADYLGFATVSIVRTDLTGISITVTERTAVARWCGSTPSTSSSQAEGQCYVFDPNGFIFEIAATSTQTLNSFSLYAPIAGNVQDPLRATLADADKLPAMFDFARRVDAFGSPVTTILIRNDEVDDYLSSGTRITYVLGNEQNAITALVSAEGNLNLSDGSLDYVDLRFDGKVYLKKVVGGGL